MDDNEAWNLIAYIVALVCFALAAANVPSRVSLIALGLAAWVSVPLVLTIRTW